MRTAPSIALAALAALTSVPLAGCVARGGRTALVVDNDVFNVIGRTDRDDTQQATLAATLTEEETPEGLRAAVRALPVFASGARAHGGYYLSQSIYTPRNTFTSRFQPDDRPYAGWLHGGLVVQGLRLDPDDEARRDRLDHLALDFGVVGPSAGAASAQSQVHSIIREAQPNGWDHQLADEPAILLSWERRLRIAHGPMEPGWETDAITRYGVDLGTIAVRATAGITGRLGFRLPRDFGPMAVDGAAVAEGGSFEGDEPRLRGHLFAGLGGRAVAHDLFLDGGVFEDGHSVESLPWVGEASVGCELAYGSFTLTYTRTTRTAEFRETRRGHTVGQVLLAWTFWW